MIAPATTPARCGKVVQTVDYGGGSRRMSDMGAASPFRQPHRPGQPIVAFDFDGTLTVRDSFTAFLRWRAGPGGWALGLVKMAPALAVGCAGNGGRGRSLSLFAADNSMLAMMTAAWRRSSAFR